MRWVLGAFMTLWGLSLAAEDPNQPIVIRLEPQAQKPKFLEDIAPPRAVQTASEEQSAPQLPPMIPQQPISVPQAPMGTQAPVPAAMQPVQTASPPGIQQFAARDGSLPPPPPVTIPTDVQNQLIKFFGLDSFGIPGLTGKHPNGFAGAMQELRAAGIPVQGLPAEHLVGQPTATQPTADVLAQANPSFANQITQVMNDAMNPGEYHPSGGVPLPSEHPGENGLIGLLSTSVRKLIKETGVADALSQSLPTVLGSGKTEQSTDDAGETVHRDRVAAAGVKTHTPVESGSGSQASSSVPRADVISASSNIRRQPSTAQRALSGIAAVLGGGGNGPKNAGLPRIPGIPLLPGGIPRNNQGQIDVVSLIGQVTRRISNGTTLADVLPPEQLQTLADNVTDALLPATPEHFDLSKFMGRWFEGVNSPRATEQRCVVHHYGGLTKNEKTATFTALKIYREGSEFGPVRYSIGYAFRAGNKDAMLQLHSSETQDAQPFWIYRLGPEGKDPFGNPQYEYAIVSNWVKYPVTVLVRDPDTFKKKYEQEVLRWLEDQGFINGFVRAFNMLQPASYTACQYADSTFEVFGK
ncbi:unnamed protein product, partial [Mesorhabditis belari]|uniref:Lipocalin domain-containing protein n=1 Tax=Mesorhabditis belari TaxID=2138241 RepID=A0AAF3F3A1_9BILA